MTPSKRKLALLIGVSEYETGFSPIATAQRDVEAMKQVLEEPDIGEFTEIRSLINPDRQEMEEAIETIFSSSEKDDLILFYFSGHGIKDESGELYFATRRTRKNPQGKGDIIKATAVDASLVKKNMNESRSKHQVIILDCCFSGAFATGLLAKGDEKVDVVGQLGGEEPNREGRAVLTSSTSMQPSFSYEGEELSIYTRYLVEGISTGAADIDCDDMISIDELHEYARRKVQEAAPAMKPEIYVARQGYKILLTKALTDDPKRRYRKEVEAQTLANQGKITSVGRRMLEYLRENLSLDTQEATAIEDEVLQPYKKYEKNLQQYEQACAESAQQEYPLSENTLRELSYYQQMLRLRDEDVAPIKEKVIRELRKNQSTNELIQLNASNSGMTSFIRNWQNTSLVVKSLTLLFLVVAGGLIYFFWKNHSILPSHSTPSEISSNSDIQSLNSMKEVQNVPSGLFNYGGSLASIATLDKHGMNDAIMRNYPGFRLRYTEPPDGKLPGSGKGIEMLIEAQLSFALSGRSLEDADYSRAKSRGFSLEQLPVAIDGIAFYVHPSLTVSGLSIDQLQSIFRGQATNWQQVGGSNLAIVPVALDPNATSAIKLLLGDDKVGSNVEIVRTPTDAIRRVTATPGAISYTSIALAAQQTIHSIAVAKAGTRDYIKPFTDNKQINVQAIQDGTYPMTRRVFVVIRRDGSVDEKAGIAYTNMLLSREGQTIIEKSGFIPIHPTH